MGAIIRCKGARLWPGHADNRVTQAAYVQTGDHNRAHRIVSFAPHIGEKHGILPASQSDSLAFDPDVSMAKIGDRQMPALRIFHLHLAGQDRTGHEAHAANLSRGRF